VKLTTYLRLVLRSRMLGTIPPLLQYTFMAWCLVKHRDNFTFLPYLYLYSCNFLHPPFDFLSLMSSYSLQHPFLSHLIYSSLGVRETKLRIY